MPQKYKKKLICSAQNTKKDPIIVDKTVALSDNEHIIVFQIFANSLC